MIASIVNFFRPVALLLAISLGGHAWAAVNTSQQFEQTLARKLLKKKRIVRFKVEHEVFWLKRHSFAKASWWACTKKVLYAPLPRIMTPTFYCSREEAVSAELARMEQLRMQGILVPEVVRIAQDYFVMKDLGKSLAKRVKKIKSKHSKMLLLQKAASALGELHAQGSIHGRGSIRDMVLKGNRVGFIDFEEPVPQRADLTLFQARDFILFLSSVVQPLKYKEAAVGEVIEAYKVHAPEDIFKRADELILPWQSWILRLEPYLAPLGQDIKNMLSALRVYIHFRQRQG